jgi:hypothetical protein
MISLQERTPDKRISPFWSGFENWSPLGSKFKWYGGHRSGKLGNGRASAEADKAATDMDTVSWTWWLYNNFRIEHTQNMRAAQYLQRVARLTQWQEEQGIHYTC